MTIISVEAIGNQTELTAIGNSVELTVYNVFTSRSYITQFQISEENEEVGHEANA
jgi:hypothetical protein